MGREKIDIGNLINKQLEYVPEANKDVLRFIFDFSYRECSNPEEYQVLYNQFMAGYCYYFAVMLNDAFNRGTICWCAPCSHIVWVDSNGVPYDFDGVSQSDCDYFIPIEYIKEAIVDFKHVPGEKFKASKEYINNAIDRYKKDNNISNYDYFIENM